MNEDLERWVPLYRLVRQLAGVELNTKLLRRWRAEGLKAPDGSRVKLVAKKIGGRWYTTLGRWEDFQAALAGQEQPKPGPSRQAQDRRQREVNRRLRELGAKV